MKTPDEPEKLIAEEGFEIKFRQRNSETVSLTIPVDTLASLKQIAASRDMSLEALLKFYIGQGLRQNSINRMVDNAQNLGQQISNE